MTEEELEEQRDNLREAIRGAFYSLAEDDKGIKTHMVAAYVEFYMAADHEPLSIPEQIGIIGLVHNVILKMLHINPVSLQMAHAHAYVHALADTYLPDDDDDDDDEPDMLLEEAGDDLEAWALELAEYMKEKEEEADGQEDPPGSDPEPDKGGDPPSE